MNKEFYDTLDIEDELGRVIRVHLHIEHYINEALSILTPYHEDLKALNLDYFGKVTLLIALGVKPESMKILKSFGSLRNKFAHDLSFKLDKSVVNNLYKELSDREKETLQESYKATHGMPDCSFKELPPKDQFTLIALVVRRMVMQLVESCKEAKSA